MIRACWAGVGVVALAVGSIIFHYIEGEYKEGQCPLTATYREEGV